jgi:antitoxin ParD1/3/4
MADVHDRRITVSQDAACRIGQKLAEGSFATAADVIDAGLQALEREAGQSGEDLAWVQASIRASLEDTRPGYSSDEMREHLRDLFEKSSGKQRDSAA